MRRESDREYGLLRLFVWATAYLICSFSQAAYAQSQVLLYRMHKQPLREGLYAALRIQLAGVANVSRAGDLNDSAITDRVATAAANVKEKRAILAVWVEGPVELADGSSELELYLVGERSGRAVVELLRLPAGKGPDIDRSLALKVREVVDVLLESHERLLLNEPSKATTEADYGPSWGWIYGAGVFAATQSGSRFGQWGVGLEGGVFLRVSDCRLAGEALLHLHGQVEIEDEHGQVFVNEVTPGVGIRNLVDYRPFSFGVLLGFQMRIIDARGVTPSSAEGDNQTVLPSFLAAGETQLEFDKVLALRLDLGLQMAVQQKVYAINNREVAILGQLRPFAQLGLVFWDL